MNAQPGLQEMLLLEVVTMFTWINVPVHKLMDKMDVAMNMNNGEPVN